MGRMRYVFLLHFGVCDFCSVEGLCRGGGFEYVGTRSKSGSAVAKLLA